MKLDSNITKQKNMGIDTNFNQLAFEFANELIRTVELPSHRDTWQIPLILLAYINEKIDYSLYIPADDPNPIFVEDRYNYLIKNLDIKSPDTFSFAIMKLKDKIKYISKFNIYNPPRKILSFTSPYYRDGVRMALEKNQTISKIYKQVVSALGRYRECEKCKINVFTIPIRMYTDPYPYFPIYNDACPICGFIHKGWIILTGLDYGHVLNKTFVSQGLIQEFIVWIGETQIKLQFLTKFLDNYSIKDVKDTIRIEIFKECKVPISTRNYDLFLNNVKLKLNKKLTDLENRELELKLNSTFKLDIEKVCEIMRKEIELRTLLV